MTAMSGKSSAGTSVFREELLILKDLFSGYDLAPFLDPDGDPAERYRLLAKAAEYVFISTEELSTESNGGKSTKKVSFKTYFLKTVKRMRAAYDICQPSGELSEEESSLAQCFMAIAGFVRKMSGTSEVDTDTMNRHVAKMVEEALRYWYGCESNVHRGNRSKSAFPQCHPPPSWPPLSAS